MENGSKDYLLKKRRKKKPKRAKTKKTERNETPWAIRGVGGAGGEEDVRSEKNNRFFWSYLLDLPAFMSLPALQVDFKMDALLM
jgi:hypothetical protein